MRALGAPLAAPAPLYEASRSSRPMRAFLALAPIARNDAVVMIARRPGS